jgi:N-methylhydantoinase A
MSSEGVATERRSVTHSVDIRYAAQEYTLTVPLTDAAEPSTPDFLATVAARFADLHRTRYGHSNLGAPIEFVTLRTTAFGDLGTPEPQKWPRATASTFPHRNRQVIFGGAAHDAVLAHRDDLLAGQRFAGPAVIVEDTATTVVPPGHEVTVDDIGSMAIRRQS